MVKIPRGSNPALTKCGVFDPVPICTEINPKKPQIASSWPLKNPGKISPPALIPLMCGPNLIWPETSSVCECNLIIYLQVWSRGKKEGPFRCCTLLKKSLDSFSWGYTSYRKCAVFYILYADLKGLGHKIELQFFYNMNSSSLNKNLYWFFGFLRCSFDEKLRLPFSQMKTFWRNNTVLFVFLEAYSKSLYSTV